MRKARNQLLLSIAFLLGSIGLYFQVVPGEAPPAPATVVAPASEHSALVIEGVWEQYALEYGQRHFMARLEIRKDGSSYIASPLALAQFTYPKHAYRSFDHVEEDGRWSFKEDWDYGNIGQFELERQENGEYVGTARSLQDGHVFRTVFVKVAD